MKWRGLKKELETFVPLSVREAGGLPKRLWDSGATYEDTHEVIALQRDRHRLACALEHLLVAVRFEGCAPTEAITEAVTVMREVCGVGPDHQTKVHIDGKALAASGRDKSA